ncbi:MAG TPA: aminotransferase class I/II-fold pyridoxal phosphate-dependent enzyme [Solirubrobacteraceae bacterium]|nr:aminotransferase class I/II-fold pyridoxal phosphate-dependent enzyme [Solirubrobacteraceae bacterium]
MHAWLQAAAAERAAEGRVRRDDVSRNPQTQGELLDLASNDYLGLAGDQRLRDAAVEATDRFGTGARASRVVTGTTLAHEELEHELARLTGRPACLAFSSGYTANLGLVTALGSPDALLITDAHIHASLIDAARLSKSPVQICPHRDLDALRRILRARAQPRAVVVVESIYSVLGDAADLAATAALCAEYDALLVVDEAHGVGVAGGGRGAVHAAGLAGAEHVVVTVTLSKALGSQGGAVLGSSLLREHLVNTARTFIFDTALAPAAATAASAACRIVAAEPERVADLHRVADAIAQAAGIDRAPGAVQSLQVGSPRDAAAAAQRMYEAGVLVGCFRPPSVPDGISRLRLTARAGVDTETAATVASRAAATIAAVASFQ